MSLSVNSTGQPFARVASSTSAKSFSAISGTHSSIATIAGFGLRLKTKSGPIASAAFRTFAQALIETLRTLGILRTESIRLWSGSQQPK